MSILPDFMIRDYAVGDGRHIVEPFIERTAVNGLTAGLSCAGYDIRTKQDLWINPGKFALLSSLEHFWMPNDVIGRVCDKSTWARRGLAVQNTVIEPGWRGWLTIEVTNHGRGTVIAKAGDPIAQVIFEQMMAPPERAYSGRYQDQADEPVEAKLLTLEAAPPTRIISPSAGARGKLRSSAMGYDCFCDYEAPSFYRKEIRKSRKSYQCEECGGPIRRGDRYEFVAGCWEGHVSQFRTCEHCHDLRQWVKNNVPCFCWAHGNLTDDAREAVEGAVFRAPAETAGLRFGFARRIVLRDRQNRARSAPLPPTDQSAGGER